MLTEFLQAEREDGEAELMNIGSLNMVYCINSHFMLPVASIMHVPIASLVLKSSDAYIPRDKLELVES